jgi:cytochrome P450
MASLRAMFRGDTTSSVKRLLLASADRLPMSVPLRYLRTRRRFDRACYALIASRRAGVEERDDLTARMLRLRDGDGVGLTDEEIRGEIVAFFLAGVESTAAALAWIWYLLVRHPEVETRLLAELRAVLGGRAPAVGDLPALEYTDRVATEALRLYPPAWILVREALRDTQIGAYRIPRGTVVLISPMVLHRDPRFFERPDAFDPDRWADGQLARLPRFAYLPFGAGPRICIGRHLAMMELTLVTAAMAQRVRFELIPFPSSDGRNRSSTRFRRTIDTLRPDGGIRVVVRRR